MLLKKPTSTLNYVPIQMIDLYNTNHYKAFYFKQLTIHCVYLYNGQANMNQKKWYANDLMNHQKLVYSYHSIVSNMHLTNCFL